MKTNKEQSKKPKVSERKEQSKNTKKSEKAINKKEVDGRDINHQEEERREIHQPRDTA